MSCRDTKGWASLQWVAIDVLARYGARNLARKAARRRTAMAAASSAETGKSLAKYDVEERRLGGCGEYPMQDGLG